MSFETSEFVEALSNMMNIDNHHASCEERIASFKYVFRYAKSYNNSELLVWCYEKANKMRFDKVELYNIWETIYQHGRETNNSRCKDFTREIDPLNYYTLNFMNFIKTSWEVLKA